MFNCGMKQFQTLFRTIWMIVICFICYRFVSFGLQTVIRIQMHDEFYSPATFKPNDANFTYRVLKRIPGFKDNIQLFSAIVGNSSTDSQWDQIFINGWDMKINRDNIQSCCISYSSGTIKSFPVLNTQSLFRQAVEFSCNISDGVDVRRASVSKTSKCHQNVSQYVSVEHPSRHSQEIAIFAKVIYGNISATDLITWFEVHKLFGFHKVYMYPYDDLNRKAIRVLHFYSQQGLLQVIPYTTPGRVSEIEGKKRYFNSENHFAWVNKQPSLYDGFARLKGYKYVMCFDPDEYIIPKKEKSYMDFFDRIFKEHKDAAGFYFQTYLYMKDWNATNPYSKFDIGRYQMRTKLTRDRVKHVYIPGRQKKDEVFKVHILAVDKGYKAYYLSADEAAIHHYRKCRPQFLTPQTKFPCFKVKRIHDNTMASYLNIVQNKVLEVAALLEI